MSRCSQRKPRRLVAEAVSLAALVVAVPRAAVAQAQRSVTLVTGDRVVVGGTSAEAVRIQPASGREQMHFFTSRLVPKAGRAPHLYVIPQDAARLIAASKVDARLFDVTLLVEFGYDDAHREDVPLIVGYSVGSAPLAARARSLSGAVLGNRLGSINGVPVTTPKARAHELWASIVAASPVSSNLARAAVSEPIQKLWLDGLRRPALDASVPQIGAPAAWALGYEGDGVVVAVLDTGVDELHPDLEGKLVASRNFTLSPDFDDSGHGTHVASIIAGSGAAEGGRYRGVAPGVQLVSGKVCEGLDCPESSIIAGAEWAVMEEGAQVVNLSIGGTDLPGLDPLEMAIDTLSADYGALFVIAAGNSGPAPESLESPGSSGAALTVGAVDRADDVAWFSSRGFRVGDHAIKPDLTAPGVDIVAARAEGTELGVPVGDAYVAASGTSMATPHAAGAAALLLQAHPDWGHAELKGALMGSARFNPAFSVADQGAGRVDVAAALATSILADTPSVSFGIARWPHEDDEVISRTLTYKNLGAATELVLELDVVGPEGNRPPPEMFTVTPSVLQLPEGGMASVTLAVDTRVVVPDGTYSGRLVASDGVSRAVATPLAAEREEEAYDLVLRHLDRQGMPTSNWDSFVFGVDSLFSKFFALSAPEGQDTTLRLPAGRYALYDTIHSMEGSVSAVEIIAANQRLDSDRLLVFDARTAKPVTLKAPSSRAENFATVLSWQLPTANGIVSLTHFFAGGAPTYYSGTLEPFAPELSATVSGQWLDSSSKAPAFYAGSWTERAKLPEGTKVMNLRKAALVQARYAASLPASQPVNELVVGAYPSAEQSGALASVAVGLPHERLEYYYSDDKSMRWVNELWMHDEEYTQAAILGGELATYRAGEHYTSRWNEPLFSPRWPEQSANRPMAFRVGDVLTVDPPMYGDRAGHPGFTGGDGLIVLYRNGERLGEVPPTSGIGFDVPVERASYRVELTLAQSLFELATRQRAVWEFESAHVDASTLVPLLSVRFAPELNERGRAARGRPFCLPFSVEQYGRRGSPRVREPRIEVSYDDGASWARAPVAAEGEGWSAQLEHPRQADYVSLRAFVRDRYGNSAEQTLIRAYALAGRD